jgi:hypothetical protein
MTRWAGFFEKVVLGRRPKFSIAADGFVRDDARDPSHLRKTTTVYCIGVTPHPNGKVAQKSAFARFFEVGSI